MKQTLTARMKSELFQAEQEAIFARIALKLEAPHGVDFCYETVNSRQATAAIRVYEKNATFEALAQFFRSPANMTAVQAETKREMLCDLYQSANNEAEANEIEREYMTLWILK